MKRESTMISTYVRSILTSCVLVGLTVGLALPVQATLVTVRFEADILSVDAGFGGVVTTSDVISGTYVYSENAGATSDTGPLFPNQAIPLAFNYTIGTFVGSSTIGQFFQIFQEVSISNSKYYVVMRIDFFGKIIPQAAYSFSTLGHNPVFRIYILA